MNNKAPLILHVIHHLQIGGLENGLVNLINHMPESDYRHAIVCIEDYSDFRQRIANPAVEVIALHRSRIGVRALRREIFRLCRHLRPAIVHTRNQSGLDALLPARLAGVAVCIHGEHGWDVDNIDGRQWKPALLKKLHAPLISHYITVSRHLKTFLNERIGIDMQRISQIYNGVDTQKFKPDPQHGRSALPQQWQDQNLIIIGTVGRLQAVKDQASLLRAFAALTTDQPALRQHLRLAIVGDGPLAKELQTLAHSLAIADITWFAGAQHAVADILRALDVFVLPSLNEGISNTILEAMACGLPVLASAVGGNVELIGDGHDGRFFQPGDTATLTALLRDYALDAELRITHGRQARAHAERQFSLNAMVAGYSAVYDRFLQNRY